MKISRAWLLRILIVLGFVIVVYSVLRHVTGFTVGEKNESFFMNVIIFAALGIFIYNRKLAAGEKKEREEKAVSEKGSEGADPPQ
jgi:Ca2+/Na+ antiporter